MRLLEFVLIFLLSVHIIKTGKLSVLRYVTQILRKILKNRTINKFIVKNQKEELLFDVDMIYGTSYDHWMSNIERTKVSINN
ncbi:unnamed protein product [Rotaria sordida]|uniref:Uncharacterized protein n=1 Tax=Rotaria sordida TaxID=392033 RepID=A0A813ULH3_9BILA|nr:unnamed protein product [Rotaria sordida]